MTSESPRALGAVNAAAAHSKVRLSLTRGNTFPQGDSPANARLGARPRDTRWRPLGQGGGDVPPPGVPAEVPALELVR